MSHINSPSTQPHGFGLQHKLAPEATSCFVRELLCLVTLRGRRQASHFHELSPSLVQDPLHSFPEDKK